MLKLKLQYFGHLKRRADSLEKTLMLEKIEGRRIRGRLNEMFGMHHQLDRYEVEQVPKIDGNGQGNLACFSSWGRQELDTTETTEQQQQCCSVTLQPHGLQHARLPVLHNLVEFAQAHVR